MAISAWELVPDQDTGELRPDLQLEQLAPAVRQGQPADHVLAGHRPRDPAEDPAGTEVVQGELRVVDYDNVDRVTGMNITVVTTANTDAEGRALLTHLGMPFRTAS